MRDTYIPLFRSITRSSLWSVSGDCLKVFLTLCADADPEGYVIASIDGIRRIADLSMSDVQRHLDTLSGPDVTSKDRTRDPAATGARIVQVPNGWRVLNLEWYRDEAKRQGELARKRRWWNESGAGARRGARHTETETDPDPSDPPISKSDQDFKLDPDLPNLKTRAKAPKRKSRIPPDLTPNAGVASLARELRVELRTELPKFVDHHTAKGSVFVDWQAALRTWVRNASQWPSRSSNGPSRGGARGGGMNADQIVERARRVGAEEDH